MHRTMFRGGPGRFGGRGRHRRQRPDRVQPLVVAAFGLTLSAQALALLPSTPETPTASFSTSVPAVPAVEAAPAPGRAAAPVKLEIPRIAVAAAVVRVGLTAEGELAVPGDVHAPGWYRAGPAPGETGPAVIVGHVDSKVGPGVFHQLRTLRPGDTVGVARADGTTVRFAITEVRRVPKDAFPSDDVYAPTDAPTLRLITCGGRFDRGRGQYDDNVIAFATLQPSERDTP